MHFEAVARELWTILEMSRCERRGAMCELASKVLKCPLRLSAMSRNKWLGRNSLAVCIYYLHRMCNFRSIQMLIALS
jgi:hypothetical protein